MKINLRELSYYKNLARALGQSNKIIDNLPCYYGYGHIAEIAAMAILGRVQRDLKNRKIYFFIESNWINDINGGFDLSINGRQLQLKSKYSYNAYTDYYNCILEYDAPGIVNLNNMLNYIQLWYFIDKEVVYDINYIWRTYMSYYGILEN